MLVPKTDIYLCQQKAKKMIHAPAANSTQVIGKTESNKPVYNGGHESYAEFNYDEHWDAANAHHNAYESDADALHIAMAEWHDSEAVRLVSLINF